MPVSTEYCTVGMYVYIISSGLQVGAEILVSLHFLFETRVANQLEKEFCGLHGGKAIFMNFWTLAAYRLHTAMYTLLYRYVGKTCSVFMHL